jgi:hypothetical protein
MIQLQGKCDLLTIEPSIILGLVALVLAGLGICAVALILWGREVNSFHIRIHRPHGLSCRHLIFSSLTTCKIPFEFGTILALPAVARDDRPLRGNEIWSANADSGMASAQLDIRLNEKT